jgi:hypothetical protein
VSPPHAARKVVTRRAIASLCMAPSIA